MCGKKNIFIFPTPASAVHREVVVAGQRGREREGERKQMHAINDTP